VLRFYFCWWANADLLEADSSLGVVLDDKAVAPAAAEKTAGRGKRSGEQLRLS